MEVEDRRFYRHIGIDPLAIARAAWANLRAGRTVQGGSTLTQQLARNFFLTPERTFTRKLNEALIALLLEWRYAKPELLEGYLNEVYLGQQGAHAIHGFGRAARHWFGRGLADLDLDEMALLAGLVRGPSYYDPRRHPERAMQRRNRIIDRLEARGVAGPDAATRARGEPLGVTRHPPPSSARFPAFVDLVRRQLRRDYPSNVLRSEGLRIFTTLDPTVQRASESALERSLPLLARRSRIAGDELQAAIAVTEAGSGEVLSIVGDRDPRRAGFNRALDAVRPVGSVVKPAVYLAALTEPQFHLASFVRDDPVQVDGPRGPWRPRNHDGRAHGAVLLRDALVHSYNLATVRLGLDVGLERVRDTIRALGASRPFATFPAMLLGTVELAPIEVSAMYHSLATGGLRQPLRAIRSVTDRQGALPRALSETLDSGRRQRRGVPRHARAARGAARGDRAPSARDSGARPGARGEDRDHRRTARQLVRGLRRGPGRRRLGRTRRQPAGEPERCKRGAGGLGAPDALDRRSFDLRCRSARRGMALGESRRRTSHRRGLHHRDAASVRGRPSPARGTVRRADRRQRRRRGFLIPDTASVIAPRACSILSGPRRAAHGGTGQGSPQG